MQIGNIYFFSETYNILSGWIRVVNIHNKKNVGKFDFMVAL